LGLLAADEIKGEYALEALMRRQGVEIMKEK
jgi:hypothetical protein